MHHNEESIGPRMALFFLPFVVSIAGACALTAYTIGPNIAGISHMLLSVMCASPLAIGLFIFANARMKKGVLRTLLPLLVFPLLFGLLFSYTMFYERNPRHMFRVFIADPIPVSVTDIRSKDISAGFDQDILVTFRASPEVIDSIIAEQQLEKAADPADGEYDFPDEHFPDYSWGSNWIFYQRTVSREDGSFNYLIMMWVDQVRSIAIYRTAG